MAHAHGELLTRYERMLRALRRPASPNEIAIVALTWARTPR